MRVILLETITQAPGGLLTEYHYRPASPRTKHFDCPSSVGHTRKFVRSTFGVGQGDSGGGKRVTAGSSQYGGGGELSSQKELLELSGHDPLL